jgi:hypothetical protein
VKNICVVGAGYVGMLMLVSHFLNCTEDSSSQGGQPQPFWRCTTRR